MFKLKQATKNLNIRYLSKKFFAEKDAKMCIVDNPYTLQVKYK
jgi:hypothetical protein